MPPARPCLRRSRSLRLELLDQALRSPVGSSLCTGNLWHDEAPTPKEASLRSQHPASPCSGSVHTCAHYGFLRSPRVAILQHTPGLLVPDACARPYPPLPGGGLCLYLSLLSVPSQCPPLHPRSPHPWLPCCDQDALQPLVSLHSPWSIIMFSSVYGTVL